MTIIFDWDGTLHKTETIYGNAFREAYQYLVDHGYAEPKEYKDEEVSKYLGMNPVVMWNTFRPDLPNEIKEHCSTMIGNGLIDQVVNGKAVLYPNALEILERFKEAGHDMVILSNCKRPYQKAYRSYFDLDRFFSDYYNSQDFDFRPKTEIFETIQKEHEGPYVIVGDRIADMEVAKEHDIIGIGCAYGYGSEKELEGADHIIDSLEEILEYIE